MINVVGNYFYAIDTAENDEAVAAVNDDLSAEEQKIIADFKASSVGEELLIGLKDVALVVL